MACYIRDLSVQAVSFSKVPFAFFFLFFFQISHRIPQQVARVILLEIMPYVIVLCV
jgi:hypothetical protein